jgi:hypothetical protein
MCLHQTRIAHGERLTAEPRHFSTLRISRQAAARMRCGLPPPAAPPYRISVASLSNAVHCFGCSWRFSSSVEVDDRNERCKIPIFIRTRYGLWHLAVEAIGDLANALYIAGESLSAQRTRNRSQIFRWPRSFEDGLERILEWLALWPATRVARLAGLKRTAGTSTSFRRCYFAVLSDWRH